MTKHRLGRALRDLLVDAAAEVPNELVAEAADGQLAVAALAVHRVDVVLIDIRMPKMDGIELARHLGKMDDAPAIIFVTAYDSYAVQAFELNAIDYLLKPVRGARLVAALQKAVRPDAVRSRRWRKSSKVRERICPAMSAAACC